MSSICSLENEEKRVTSICSEEDCSTKEARKTDKLECARAEMGEVKEENERLKMMLERVENDYHSLQLRFFDILQRETSSTSTTTSPDEVEEHHNNLVSLCLGTSPSEPKKERVICNSSNNNKPKENNEDFEANLTLGLDSKSLLSLELVSDLSTINSSEELKEEAEQRRTCSTNKSVRYKDYGVDEISEQTPTKRARVCVRARCDTPTMIDGCQWRKYGQKIAKGNPCPRAYYRCTVAPACPVRKQVQRCADDMSILITTYEGTHNHPLPVSATAMASTTSAAASMLLSGSSSSTTSCGNSPTLFTGLNFFTHHFDQSSTRSKQAFLPNTTASHLFPTITLDLTSTSPNSSSTRFHFSPSSPRFFHPFSLSFNTPQSSWLKGFQNYATMPIDEKTHISTLNQGNQFQEQFYQHWIKNQAPFKDALAETLTRAISTDLSLHSAIAAAVSSIERKGLTIGNKNGGEILGSGLSLKLGDNPPQFNSSNPLNQNGKAGLICHPNRTSSSSSSSSLGGNLMLLQPPRPFTLSKSSTTSSNIDNIKNWVQEINSHR